MTLGNWQGLTHQPPFQTSTMILLSDGRVMVQEEATAHWHALTPDSSGSYMNGTWSTLADMRFWRRYYASGMLKDGRVILIGGEQNGDFQDTNKGEIYDPVADTWTPLPTPPLPNVGDASCCVLPDGRFLVGYINDVECVLYDPATNSWSAAGNKQVRSNEETWVLLPDETIVTINCIDPHQNNSEKYVIGADTWKSEGPQPVPMVDPVMSEIGPAMLLPNGKVIFFGANNAAIRGSKTTSGRTVIFTPPPVPTGTGTWTEGPNIPHVGNQAIVCNDCPASLLPNGKVLFAGAPWVYNDWGAPIYFFEYDPDTNTIAQAPTPANNGQQIFWSRLMLLPTGQVLFSPSSQDIQCYTPVGGPKEAWRPTIATILPCCESGGYLLKGTQLNGLSQANMYGDDCTPATNYPLVRLRSSSTGRVYYARTYDFSTMGVATGASLQSTRFALPAMPYGSYDLCVIANGISSHCVDFCYQPHKHCCCPQEAHDCRCGCQCARSCACEQKQTDPVVANLQSTVKSLQNSIARLSAMVQPSQEVRQPKEAKAATKSSGSKAKK